MRKIFNIVTVCVTISFLAFVGAAGFAEGGNGIAAVLCLGASVGFGYIAYCEDGYKRK